MSKKIYLLFTFLILTGAVIFVFSKKIKDYENSVISQIEKSFGANIVVNDGISYKFFGITLNNVKILRYSGEISSNLSCVEINFKKLPLFLLKFQVASIKLKGGQVNLKSCKTIRYDLPYKLLLEDINFRVYRFLPVSYTHLTLPTTSRV